MPQVFLLNASYEPLKVVNWQKAIPLWCQGKVEVIAVHDREIRAVSVSFKLPSVIRLLRFVRIKRRFDYVPFSRANIYARDNHTCQYCSARTRDLTIDHVIPRSRGGPHTWENLVSACKTCNHRKGGKNLSDTRMRLARIPREPKSNIYYMVHRFLEHGPLEEWLMYLPGIQTPVSSSNAS